MRYFKATVSLPGGLVDIEGSNDEGKIRVLRAIHVRTSLPFPPNEILPGSFFGDKILSLLKGVELRYD